MSKARNLADLLNASGDVKSDRLDNQSDATSSARGLMTASMKNKLDGIEAGATGDQTKADIEALGINYNNLSNKPTLFDSNTLATVATTGSYTDLSNKPAPFDPNTLATVATTGSYSDLTNIPDVSTSSLSSNFTVATGKTVSAGDVVNYSGGEIGVNPVVNTQSTLIADSTQEYSLVNGDGSIVVKDQGSGVVQVGLVNTTTGAITWQSASSDMRPRTDQSYSLKWLGGNIFSIAGGVRIGNWSCNAPFTGYGFARMFEVNTITGAVTWGNSYTFTKYSGVYAEARGYIGRLTDDKSYFRQYLEGYNSGSCGGTGTSSNYYVNSTSNGSLSLTSTFAEVENFENETNIVFANGSKMLNAIDTNAALADWNGSTLSNYSSISLDSTYSSDMLMYRPEASSDIFICAFKNTSNEIVINTYSYSSGSVTRTNNHVLISSGSDVLLGSLRGDGNNVILSYRTNSKGYITTFTLDPTTKAFLQEGIAVQQNTSNEVPILAKHSTDKCTALFNTGSKVNSNILTINAYSSARLNWVGVAKAGGTSGGSVEVIIDGVSDGFTGLTPGLTYYYDTSSYDGSVTTSITEYPVGVAISQTEIKING